MKCAICSGIGNRLLVDFDEGGHLPLGVQSFSRLDKGGEILQCPSCSTCYRLTFKTDNDIYNPIHMAVLQEISTEEANAVVAKERTETRAFEHALAVRFGNLIATLDQDALEVFQFICRRQWSSTSLPMLKVQFASLGDRLGVILDDLISKHMIATQTVKSLRPGKYGYQDEVAEISDEHIRYYMNFSQEDFAHKQWAMK
jgi:hypothetical protein